MMGLPALVLPERLLLPELADGQKEKFHSEFGVAWKQLGARARPFRGLEDSDEESQLLHLFGVLMLPTVSAIGLSTPALRAAAQRGMDDVLHREFAASEVTKKVALRRLGTALHTFAVVVELISDVSVGLADETWAALIRALSGPMLLDELEQDPTFRLFLRWQLALMMSFEALEWPAADLAYWTQRAAALSLRIEALQTTLVQADALRVDLARLVSGR
jgi:hypothetical protein